METRHILKEGFKFTKRPSATELKQRHPRYAKQVEVFLRMKRERFENRKRSMLGEGRNVSDLEYQHHEALLKALEHGTLEMLDHLGSYRARFRRTCSQYTKGDFVLRYVSSPASWKHRAGRDGWVLYDRRTLKQKDSIRLRVN